MTYRALYECDSESVQVMVHDLTGGWESLVVSDECQPAERDKVSVAGVSRADSQRTTQES